MPEQKQTIKENKVSRMANSGGRSGPRPAGRAHGAARGMLPVDKAKDVKGSIRRLLRYLAPDKFRLIIIILSTIIGTLFSIFGPRVLAQATDTLVQGITGKFSGAAQGVDFARISRILLIALGLYLLSLFFQYLQGWLMAGVSTRISYRLRQNIMKKINRLPLAYFHRVSQGDVLSRITNDVDTISQNLSQSMTTAVSSVFMLIGILAMMFSISWQMSLIALVILPVSIVLVSVIVRHSQKHFQGQQNYLGSINGKIEESFGGHLVIKAFGSEAAVVDTFESENEKLYQSAWKAQFWSGIMMPVMNFVGNLGYVAVCIAGAAFASSGIITIGDIQAFIQYVRSFTQPISQLAGISNMLQMTAAAAERVFEFLDGEELQPETAPLSLDTAGLRGDVRFEHVRFTYEGKEQPVIHDFSAEIKSGQKIAIVGPTGAGKTTMVKLLMRFHELDSGHIYVDGVDAASIPRAELRRAFGMVLQDTWLYSGSILENIRYGKLNATDEEVYAAARAAQVDHFVHTLPGGYQLKLNEEATNLSQGQKQLLTIARAILADSKILILDEATSSVDTRTEIMIQKAMDNLMKGRTSFIIAHRLSTIRNADLILCMDHGDIVEQGTHDELMARNGFYARLYNSQFEHAA